MIYRLSGVLTAEERRKLDILSGDISAFADGTATAGWAAREVKANQQLGRGTRLDEARKIVSTAMMRHPVFASAALPRKLVSIMVSRYEPGMAYGAHVDDALMGGERTDLSFTLFLNAPASYDGGALVIHSSEGATEIKLDAGDAVLYATGLVHEVEPVSSGVRLAAVGWVRSHVRAAEQREVLFDLDLAARATFQKDGNCETFKQIQKSRANLLRMWAD